MLSGKSTPPSASKRIQATLLPAEGEAKIFGIHNIAETADGFLWKE